MSGKIVMIGSMKGGVSKTVTTFNLAYSLSKLGKKVLAVDFDSQANLSTFLMTEIRQRFRNILMDAVLAADVWMHSRRHGLSMREKEVEQKLVKAVKARGGICPKWVSPGFDGMPDRIVFLPGRHIGFVEVKAPGEKPRALQKSRHRLLEKMGFHTYILDGIEQIGGILDEIQST